MWIWADDFKDSGEKFRKYHQSCIPPVQTNILPKKCFGEKEFNACGFSGEKFQNFGGKVSGRYFWGNKFCKKKGSSNHLLTLGEKVSNFSSKVPSSAVKTAFNVSGGWNQERNCFWKYRILQFSPTSRRTFRTVSDKFLAGYTFMHFAYPKGGFGRDSCLESGLHNHGLQAIKVVGFFKKFRQGCQKQIPCVKMILLEKNTFRNFQLFPYLWSIIRNLFQTFGRQFKGWIAETALYGFRNIWKKKPFQPEVIFPISFGFWADDFRASGQKVRKVSWHCTLCVRSRFSKVKTLKLKSFLSISLWIWADDFQDSGENCRKYHQSGILLVQTNILPKTCFGEKEFNTCGFSGKIS